MRGLEVFSVICLRRIIFYAFSLHFCIRDLPYRTSLHAVELPEPNYFLKAAYEARFFTVKLNSGLFFHKNVHGFKSGSSLIMLMIIAGGGFTFTFFVGGGGM